MRAFRPNPQYCTGEAAAKLLTSVVHGYDEERFARPIATFHSGLVTCGSSAPPLGPEPGLEAEVAREDAQVCCIREDVLDRVDEVVVPASGGGHDVTLTRAALLDNLAVQPDGRYACITVLRNQTTSWVASRGSGSQGAAVTAIGVLPDCVAGWRCNSAVVSDTCTSVCRCPQGMHAVEGIWRCSDGAREKQKVQLEVFDEFWDRYDDGDRVLVVKHTALILRYRYEACADATLLEQVSGEEPWKFPVLLSSSKAGAQKHEGTLVLWNVTTPQSLLFQLTLHSRPALVKSVTLSVAVVPELTIGIPCLEDGDCRSVNAICLERQCRCSFALEQNGTCVVVGCRKNDDCARNPGTVCVESTCRCPASSDLRNGKCWPHACRSHYECAHKRPHTVCFRNSCVCKHGFREVDKVCTPLECYHDVECRDPLMRCLNGSCGCSKSYLDNGERCVPKFKACGNRTNCSEPTTSCNNRSCSCPQGFHLAGHRCIQVARQQKKCHADDDCKWSDLCLERPCVCRRESPNVAGVCVETASEPSEGAGATTSARTFSVTAAGGSIFLFTAAALGLFLAFFSKKKAIETTTVFPGAQEATSTVGDGSFRDKHMCATNDDPPDRLSISATEEQLSFEENVREDEAEV